MALILSDFFFLNNSVALFSNVNVVDENVGLQCQHFDMLRRICLPVNPYYTGKYDD